LKPARSNRLAHKPNMKLSLSITTALATLPFAEWVHGAMKPHGLFIAVDDVNDWIGCMDGHPIKKNSHAP
jgi:choline-sulfatase